jgi:hypothetical protein
MTSSLTMRSWEARRGKVTGLFMHGLLRVNLAFLELLTLLISVPSNLDLVSEKCESW